MPVQATTPVNNAQALLSWWADLTDPNVKPEPLAVVLVAEHGVSRSVVIVQRIPARFEQLDNLTRTMIMTLPKRVAELVKDAVKRLGQAAPLDTLLDHVQSSLTGNIAVSARYPAVVTKLTAQIVQVGLFDRASATLRDRWPTGTEASTFYSKLYHRLDHA
jgi:hypothetical protein